MGWFKQSDPVDETFSIKAGPHGSMHVHLKTGTVARAVKQVALEARVEIADEIARDWQARAPRGDGPLRGRPARLHESITSGETNSDPPNAYVRAAFPAMFVWKGGEVNRRPVDFISPGLAAAIPRLQSAIQSRKL